MRISSVLVILFPFWIPYAVPKGSELKILKIPNGPSAQTCNQAQLGPK